MHITKVNHKIIQLMYMQGKVLHGAGFGLQSVGARSGPNDIVAGRARAQLFSACTVYVKICTLFVPIRWWIT